MTQEFIIISEVNGNQCPRSDCDGTTRRLGYGEQDNVWGMWYKCNTCELALVEVKHGDSCSKCPTC